MKKLISYLTIIAATALLIAGPIVFVSGCASAERATFKAAGITGVTAEKAIMAWGDYVAQQKQLGTPVSLEQELRVKHAWDSYQLALKTVTDAGIAYSRQRTSPNPADVSSAEATLNAAAAVLSASIGDLIELIASFGVKVQ